MKNLLNMINTFFKKKYIKFCLIVSVVFAMSFFVCLIQPTFESQLDIFNSNEKTFEFINSSRAIIFTILGISIGFLGFSYRFVLEKIQINYFKYILNNWVILSTALLSSYLVLSTRYLSNYNSTNISFMYFIYFLFIISMFSSIPILYSMIKILNFKSILDGKIKNADSIFLEIYKNNENKNVYEELEEVKSICYYYIKNKDYKAENAFQKILYYYCNEISKNQNGGPLNDASDRVIKYAKEFFDKSIDIALSEKNTPFIIHQLSCILEIYKISNTYESDENFNNFLIRKNIVDKFIIDYLFNNRLDIGYKGSLIFDKLIRSGLEELIIHSINILKEILIFELEKVISNKNNNNIYNNSINFVNDILQILSYAIVKCEKDKTIHVNVVNFICDNLPSNIYSYFEIKYKNIEKDKFVFKSPSGPINLIDTIFNRLCDIHIDIIKKNSYDNLYINVPFYLNLKHFDLKNVKNNYVNLLEAVEEKDKTI